MKTSIVALLALALSQPTPGVAGGRGDYRVSGALVVGGPGGARGGYHAYAPRWGYPGPRVGVYLGVPLLWGGWPAPAYYPPVYPPFVTVPPPVVYVERAEAAPGTGESLEPGYWYYCRERGAYYPAVAQCPGAWQKVAPVNN